MDRILLPMLGQNVQAYGHISDLEKLFAIGRHNLKLNSEKCVFSVQAGKFLGFLVTERGIKANPEKCTTIMEMRSPTNVNEVQSLIGRMATLSHFLSPSGDKGYPYFQCLRKNDRFIWIDDYEEAFFKLKEYLANPPILNKPTPRLPIRLYFSVTDRVISLVILQEEGKVQRPIYFISRCRDSLPNYRKSSLGSGFYSPTTASLLLEFHHSGNDRPTYLEGPSEV